MEYRDTLGADIPPSKLGAQFGSATQTGTGFSDFGSNLSEVAWRQAHLGGRLKWVFGKISAVGWYTGHTLSSPKRGFQNTAMLSSLSKATPGRGIGGGVAYKISPHFVVLGGIHDANARTTQNPFDTIGDKEFMQSFELRYYPTTPDRHRWDQVRVQIWHQDARMSAGIPSSNGVSFAASRIINDKWMPFIVAGVSDGNVSIFKKDIAVGVGIGFKTTGTRARDILGFGLGWGDPPNPDFQEQITSEIFYRFQFLDNIALTPSVQMIKNPASNPEETTVWVAGLRLRLTF
jgi:carbohydrate-selective porin OprB